MATINITELKNGRFTFEIEYDIKFVESTHSMEGVYRVDNIWTFRPNDKDKIIDTLQSLGYKTKFMKYVPDITYETTGDNLYIHVEYNDKMLEIFRSIKGYRWSPDLKCMYIPRDMIGLYAERLRETFGVPLDSTHEKIDTLDRQVKHEGDKKTRWNKSKK